MPQHRYRIIVKSIKDATGGTAEDERSLQFEIGNHDDIFSVVERLSQRGGFDQDTAAAFGVGLKLFSEVMLQHKDNPLFLSL